MVFILCEPCNGTGLIGKDVPTSVVCVACNGTGKLGGVSAPAVEPAPPVV